MRIIQVIPEFCFGGAETMCANLSIELKKLGHEVLVISLYNYESAITDRLKENKIKVIFLDKKSGINPIIILKLSGIMKKFKPDVVHTHLYAAKYAHCAAVLTGVKKRVHTIHSMASYDGDRLEQTVNKFLIKFMKVIPVSLSREIQKTVEDVYQITADETPVVLNGVPLDFCKRIENYKDEAKTFIHVGRFAEAKNHTTLINAFVKVNQKKPGVELFLYGDGEKKDDCVELVRKNNAESYIHFCGVTGDIYSKLKTADVFLLPSLWEGIPMTLIEAMASGLPIIASNVGGIPDMFENGVSAILIQPTEEALIQAILKIIDEKELRRTLGMNALNVADTFSAKKMAEHYLSEVYR